MLIFPCLEQLPQLDELFLKKIFLSGWEKCRLLCLLILSWSSGSLRLATHLLSSVEMCFFFLSSDKFDEIIRWMQFPAMRAELLSLSLNSIFNVYASSPTWS